MEKKILLLLVFILINSCGYQSIYSKKNQIELSVSKIEKSGDKILNKKIISQIPFNLNDNSNKVLVIDTQKQLDSISKDKAGNTKIYNLTITSKVSLKNKDKIINSKNFTSSFSYNNISNKFDLEQYGRNIEQNLTNKIAEEISIFFVSINDN
tara:strand:- start:8 stop:466 length:459 start_codon:yes stop_codon:yes gene_type:complete